MSHFFRANDFLTRVTCWAARLCLFRSWKNSRDLFSALLQFHPERDILTTEIHAGNAGIARRISVGFVWRPLTRVRNAMGICRRCMGVSCEGTNERSVCSGKHHRIPRFWVYKKKVQATSARALCLLFPSISKHFPP